MYNRHGVEVAGALRREAACGSRRNRRAGAEPKYTTATNKRILALLDQTPPEGYARWTGPLLAASALTRSPRSRRWSGHRAILVKTLE